MKTQAHLLLLVVFACCGPQGVEGVDPLETSEQGLTSVLRPTSDVALGNVNGVDASGATLTSGLFALVDGAALDPAVFVRTIAGTDGAYVVGYSSAASGTVTSVVVHAVANSGNAGAGRIRLSLIDAASGKTWVDPNTYPLGATTTEYAFTVSGLALAGAKSVQTRVELWNDTSTTQYSMRLLQLWAVVTTSDSSGGGSCTGYTPTPNAIDFRSAAGATAEAKLETAIAAASLSTKKVKPPAYPMGYGPNAPQGVVRITYVPADGPFTKSNRIEFASTVSWKSNVRLEIDSGVALVYRSNAEGALFRWDGLTNVTVTVGNPCQGTGWEKGRYVIDLSVSTAMRKQFIFMLDVSRWLIESVHTRSDYQLEDSASAAIPFHGLNANDSPRFGVYRHHSNTGSADGWGPNQVTSLWDSYIEDIRTQGGTALRMETDGKNSGVHRVTAKYIYGENGNKVVSFAAHDTTSEDVTIIGVRGVSMLYGWRHTGGPGRFERSSLTDGCVVPGNFAQDPGQEPRPAVQSNSAWANDNSLGSIRLTNVLRSGAAPGFTSGNPGGTVSSTCTEAFARSSFYP